MADELIELNIGRECLVGSDDVDQLLDIVDRLLALISDVATGNEHLKTTPEFRSQLVEFRKALCGQGSGEEISLQAMAETCLSTCEYFFSRAREHALNREIEFIEIIDVLRETVRNLTGLTMEFNQTLVGSSERFHQLLEIDDLQVLKQRITTEAKDLSRIVEEKQKSDQETYSKLSSKIETLQRRLERAEEEAVLDPLTQVANRCSFDCTIEQWVQLGEEVGQTFSLGMIDLDDFKQVNDQFGHQVGDRVLLGAAQMLSKFVRSGDMVARYGGEEFAVLLRNCGIERAEERFRQILSEIASTQYEYRDGKQKGYIHFTASCGVAEFGGSETSEELIQRSDNALYEAKKRGKNCVVLMKKSRLRGLFRSRRSSSA